MTYFSRLSDIITCNLTDILRESDDPAAALAEVILEMEEGLAGARRSVATAGENADRLRGEIDTIHAQVAAWQEAAKNAIGEGREEEARAALSRKQEVADVAAGMEQEYAAALATRDHLETMLRALRGRLAEARRREAREGSAIDSDEGEAVSHGPSAIDARSQAIEDELNSLKRDVKTDK